MIKENERKILSAALDFEDKKAEDIMTKIDDAYMLEINEKLDE